MSQMTVVKPDKFTSPKPTLHVYTAHLYVVFLMPLPSSHVDINGISQNDYGPKGDSQSILY